MTYATPVKSNRFPFRLRKLIAHFEPRSTEIGYKFLKKKKKTSRNSIRSADFLRVVFDAHVFSSLNTTRTIVFHVADLS